MRWLRRRRLLREAEALEREAACLNRALVRHTAYAGLAGLTGAFVQGSSVWPAVARATSAGILREERDRISALEARAKALREEAS